MKRKRGHLKQLDEYTWVVERDDGDWERETVGDHLRAWWYLVRAAWALVFGRGGSPREPKAHHTGHEA